MLAGKNIIWIRIHERLQRFNGARRIKTRLKHGQILLATPK